MIEARIDNSEFRREQSAVIRGGKVLKAMQQAGAPVKGVLFIETVERGTLTMFQDEMFDQSVYQWRDEGEV